MHSTRVHRFAKTSQADWLLLQAFDLLAALAGGADPSRASKLNSSALVEAML